MSWSLRTHENMLRSAPVICSKYLVSLHRHAYQKLGIAVQNVKQQQAYGRMRVVMVVGKASCVPENQDLPLFLVLQHPQLHPRWQLQSLQSGKAHVPPNQCLIICLTHCNMKHVMKGERTRAGHVCSRVYLTQM
jgi:hypothetical protein